MNSIYSTCFIVSGHVFLMRTTCSMPNEATNDEKWQITRSVIAILIRVEKKPLPVKKFLCVNPALCDLFKTVLPL